MNSDDHQQNLSIPLCKIEDITANGTKGFYLEDGRAILVVRKEAQVFVYLNRCPHRLVYLEHQPDQFLDTTGSFIQCSTHGALFEIESGVCVSGPCLKQTLEHIDYTIKDGHLYIEAVH